MKATPSPRVIFIGGSGLFSGLDGHRVEERLKMNSVNLGFFAGFGILPYLDPLVNELKYQDVVVLVPEYGVMANGLDATPRARPWLLALHPSFALKAVYPRNFAGLSMLLEDVVTLVRSKVESFQKLAFCWSSRPGFRKAGREMDLNGDLTESGQFHRVSEGSLLGRGTEMPRPFPLGNALARLNRFYSCALEKGAEVYFAWPAYPAPELSRNESQIRELEKDFRRNLHIPILGAPSDFAFPYRNFTNTVDHLDVEGKRLRTERLISLLEKRREYLKRVP
ncbi:MAG: hypothetical protein IPP35_12500 [Elusimicrobia bacterium]|nr:hypothetical protein [Elusimicrobiota bacterium]